jgi:hypothetical protein
LAYNADSWVMRDLWNGAKDEVKYISHDVLKSKAVTFI